MRKVSWNVHITAHKLVALPGVVVVVDGIWDFNIQPVVSLAFMQ